MNRNGLVTRLFPFLAWVGDVGKGGAWRKDLVAGVTVAMVLIPQSMAYAQLAGLPPYFGLYAAFMPPVIAALFGSSRQLATGPVAVVSLMTAAALEPIASAGSEGYVLYAVLLALMVGVFQMSLGLLRLGVLVNFLSHPVVLGFTNAAAIIIATSQLGKLFGVSVPKAEHHYETVWNTLVAGLQWAHLPTVVMALLAFTIMIGLRKISPRLPGVLIAVLVTTLGSWWFGFEQVRTVPRQQISGAVVNRILNDRVQLQNEIRSLDKSLVTARTQLAELRTQETVDEALILRAQHEVDLLRLKRERRSKSLKADELELKSVHFYFDSKSAGGSGAFVVRGHGAENTNVESSIWRVRSISDEGGLTLHAGGAVVGVVPRGLPKFSLPHPDWQVILELLVSAVTISLIGFMEAIAIAKGMAARTRQRLDANQELVGQGLANFVGGLFQSYPIAGSFSRSAVNLEAGAVTGFSSVITSLVVVVVLMWLTPLLYHLPQATLAAVIMMAVFSLIRIGPVRHAWKVHRHDGLAAVVTFVLTLALAPHLDKGILAGVILSLGLYLFRTMKPRLAVLSRSRDGSLRDAQIHQLETCGNITVIRFDGSLYFANIGYFEDKVLENVALKPDLQYVIVDAEGINSVDASGEDMLVALAQRLRESGIQLLFARVKKQVFDALARTGFIERQGGADHFFRRTEHALQHAWDQLGGDHARQCPLSTSTPAKD